MEKFEKIKEAFRLDDNHLPRIFKQTLPNCDPNAADLLDKMLVYDPLKRLSAKECLEHPYFKSEP